jgi:hypothetical protein
LAPVLLKSWIFFVLQVDTPDALKVSVTGSAASKFGDKNLSSLDAGRKILPLQENGGDHTGILAAVSVFHEMQQYGLKPNVVTFSAILNACR